MQFTLTPQSVQRLARDLLRTHLALTDYGRCCPVAALVAVLFAACARLTSLWAAACGLRRGPGPETVRKALHAHLPRDATRLERRLHQALHAVLPAALRKRRQRVAADLTLIPYHGQPHTDPTELYRGQAKSGTTHFHAYATLYLLVRGQRFTVALTWVRQGEDAAAVLRRLLRTAAQAGIRPRLVLLDRGFYTVAVIRYLQAARYPFVLPLPLKGRRASHPHGPGGTRVFAGWPRSGWGSYTLHSTGQPRATVGVCVHCRNRAGRRQRHGRERLVYAYWGWQPATPAAVSALYRRRFGIESSYRQMNQARPRTCSRDPRVRLVLVGVALLLRNVWVWLHWEVVAGQRRGARRLRLRALPLKHLLLMLLHVAEQQFASADEVATERPLPTILEN
jgi:putative transposase